MSPEGEDGPDEFRDAAERAREQLRRQLGGEGDRLDAELAELGRLMTESAARVAEERVETKAIWLPSGE